MSENAESQLAIPKYQQIALDLASRIVSEEYKEGQKVYARSALASQYGVSPETARRAICVLDDLDIVAAEKGSGVVIQSRKKAKNFLAQYNKRQTISSIKDKLLESVTRQQKEMDNLNVCLSELIEASEHFRSMNPFMPYEVSITNACPYLRKSIADIQFWQRTGATLLAVRRQNRILKSPGPYIALLEDDILYFLPQDDSPQRVKEFLYPPQTNEEDSE